MADEQGAGAVHEAGDLSYDTGVYARDACWPMLPAYLREQLTEIIGGEIKEWWALGSAQSAAAVVLGPAGLCHAEPVIDTDGQRRHGLRTARFEPRSRWVLTSGSPVSLPATSGTGAAGNVDLPLADSLDEDFRGLLGNLPASTQITLQELFTPRPDLAYASYYEQQELPGKTTWRFLCYITDDATLTFGSGIRTTTKQTRAKGGRTTEEWDVTCYRATVIEQIPRLDDAPLAATKRPGGQRRSWLTGRRYSPGSTAPPTTG
jgi:hypothetical protein